jgi:hypothetical protein
MCATSREIQRQKVVTDPLAEHADEVLGRRLRRFLLAHVTKRID